MADVVPPSIALAVVTKLSEKCKSTSPSAIQVKTGTRQSEQKRNQTK